MTNPSKTTRTSRAGLCILVALLVFTLWPAGRSWFATVSRMPFSQNGLQWISLIVLGIAIIKNVRLPGLQTSLAGFLAFGAVALAYLLAGILNIYALYWASGLGLIATGIWALYGERYFYNILNLAFFSLFLLPKMPLDIYTGISVPLQMLSTQLTSAVSGLVIPVTHQGNVFYINNHAFEVTVACSGLNTWIGFLFAGLLWLVFDQFSFKKLLFVLLSAPVLALAVNTTRLLITAFVAYYHSADAAVSIHTNLEYVLFPLGLIAMAWLGRKCLTHAAA